MPAFIPNDSSPAAIANNNQSLKEKLAIGSVYLYKDIWISDQINISGAQNVQIVGEANARLISTYNGIPLVINSVFPSANPPTAQCFLERFTFIHKPDDGKLYSHIYANGINLGKYLNIRNLIVSHFWPATPNETKDVYSVDIRNAAGINIQSLYCHSLATGGLFLDNAGKVVLNDYRARCIVGKSRPLYIRNSSVIEGDWYCEKFNQPPLFENVKRCEKGFGVWSEFSGYLSEVETTKPKGHLLELVNSEIGLSGNYGQDSNLVRMDSYSRKMCDFRDLIKPYGKLVTGMSLLGELNNWPSEIASINNNNLVASKFNDTGQQKVKFPTNLPNLSYKVGDLFFVTGTLNLTPELQQWYYQAILDQKIDLPIMRVTMNDTDMGQNFYANPYNNEFRAFGKVTKDGINPTVWLLFYGDATCQPPVPIKINFSNILLWYVTS